MATESEPELQLRRYREVIDDVDMKILALMQRRIAAAQSIAEIKRNDREPMIYRPEREAQVLHRLIEANRNGCPDADGQPHGSASTDGGVGEAGTAGRRISGLKDSDIESLFREIMSITRGSEAHLSTALLGPAGTFTEAAALQHFGSKIEMRFLPTIDEIFKAAETGETDFAVVPIENSTEGGVNATLDRLANTSLHISGEIYLRIHHNLISSVGSAEQVERVFAHPQALGQCRRWLGQNLPKAELVPCSSNAEGVRQAEQSSNTAAIASREAAERYGLHILMSNIEDEPGNTTRFLVLGNRQTPASGSDKTSLLLAGRNRPGALFHLLKPLVDHRLDMTRIESRPARSALWEYMFFVDLKGHKDDPEVAAALDEIKLEAGLYRHLGSYPLAL